MAENRSAPGDLFRELDTQLAALRIAAKSLREERPSWADNIFHPGRRARQEAEFDAAVVTALKEIESAVQTALAQQESKLAEFEPQMARQREELERLGREQTEAGNRAADLRDQIDQAARENAARQNAQANEFRERIQNLLDEQRVSIRQLSLKASEDAVLGDRTRRALELKLEDLAKRLPPTPPA